MDKELREQPHYINGRIRMVEELSVQGLRRLRQALMGGRRTKKEKRKQALLEQSKPQHVLQQVPMTEAAQANCFQCLASLLQSG